MRTTIINEYLNVVYKKLNWLIIAEELNW